MSCNMIGDFLVYTAHRCDFFQVIVHLLVADCLVPFLDYPQVAVKGNLYVLCPQLAHIHIRQASITAKNEHITHLLQPLASKGFLIDAV